MIVKAIIDEDFSNYKKPSMLIGCARCSFKCDKECGKQVCQNSALATAPDVEISIDEIIKRYEDNNLTQAIVFGGLEPLDSWDELCEFIIEFRTFYQRDDKIVIYTGYNKDEVEDKIETLWHFGNIIIKFGRYIPNQQPHYDEILGVNLASDNQYAERIS